MCKKNQKKNLNSRIEYNRVVSFNLLLVLDGCYKAIDI